jgi:deoxycytidylate deaminase
MTKLNMLYNQLKPYAKLSPVSHKLSACIVKGKKIISKICCNTDRNMCRGLEVGSLHAEANAIVNYFGKDLSYDQHKGWCVLWN